MGRNDSRSPFKIMSMFNQIDYCFSSLWSGVAAQTQQAACTPSGDAFNSTVSKRAEGQLKIQLTLDSPIFTKTAQRLESWAHNHTKASK